jgi:molybdopterin converting factor small subunit
MNKMVINVTFIGAFRNASGKSKFTITSESRILLKKAIKEIVEELPKLKTVLIDPELENPKPNTLILVNGKEISVLNGLDTILENGDEVVFVPVVHGG